MDMNALSPQEPLSCTGCKGTLWGVVGYCPFCGVRQPEDVIETGPRLEVEPPPHVVVESSQVVDPVQNSEAGQAQGADPDVNSNLDEKLGQDQGADHTPLVHQTQVIDESPAISQTQTSNAAQTADAPQTAHQMQAPDKKWRFLQFFLESRPARIVVLFGLLAVLVLGFLGNCPGPNDGSLYAGAEQAFNSKDIATAKSRLDEFLGLVPNDKRGIALRGRIVDLQGRHEALYKEAKALATKGDVAAATNGLRIIVNEDVSNREAQALLQSLAQIGRARGADCQGYEEQVKLALGQKDFIKAQYLADAARAGRCSQASALITRVRREGEAVPRWVRDNTSFAFDELTRARNQITSGRPEEGRRMAEAVIEIYGRDSEVLQEAQNVLNMVR